MAFRYAKFGVPEFGIPQLPVQQMELQPEEIVPPPKAKEKKTKRKPKYDVSSEEEETLFDWVIDNKPSTNKLRKLLRNHIEELIDLNDEK